MAKSVECQMRTQLLYQYYYVLIESKDPWLCLHFVTYVTEIRGKREHLQMHLQEEETAHKLINPRDEIVSLKIWSSIVLWQLLAYITNGLEPEYWHEEGHAPARMKGCENSVRIIFSHSVSQDQETGTTSSSKNPRHTWLIQSTSIENPTTSAQVQKKVPICPRIRWHFTEAETNPPWDLRSFTNYTSWLNNPKQ